MSEESKQVGAFSATPTEPRINVFENKTGTRRYFWVATERGIDREVVLADLSGISIGSDVPTWMTPEEAAVLAFAIREAASDYGWRFVVDASIGALKAELESCRARLSTAEKESTRLKNSLGSVEEDLRVVRLQLLGRLGPQPLDLARDNTGLRAAIGTLFQAIGHGDEKHRAWLRGAIGQHFRAALSGSNATDAPTAPKASEIASDSSAMEKALGALRAGLPLIGFLVCCLRSGERLVPGDDGWIDHTTTAMREVLSGGAHVDGPKAPKNPSDPDPR